MRAKRMLLEATGLSKISNYSGRHKGTERQRHKVERSEEKLCAYVPLSLCA
jgi:hypothetical protein